MASPPAPWAPALDPNRRWGAMPEDRSGAMALPPPPHHARVPSDGGSSSGVSDGFSLLDAASSEEYAGHEDEGGAVVLVAPRRGTGADGGGGGGGVEAGPAAAALRRRRRWQQHARSGMQDGEAPTPLSASPGARSAVPSLDYDPERRRSSGSALPPSEGQEHAQHSNHPSDSDDDFLLDMILDLDIERLDITSALSGNNLVVAGAGADDGPDYGEAAAAGAAALSARPGSPGGTSAGDADEDVATAAVAAAATMAEGDPFDGASLPDLDLDPDLLQDLDLDSCPNLLITDDDEASALDLDPDPDLQDLDLDPQDMEATEGGAGVHAAEAGADAAGAETDGDGDDEEVGGYDEGEYARFFDAELEVGGEEQEGEGEGEEEDEGSVGWVAAGVHMFGQHAVGWSCEGSEDEGGEEQEDVALEAEEEAPPEQVEELSEKGIVVEEGDEEAMGGGQGSAAAERGWSCDCSEAGEEQQGAEGQQEQEQGAEREQGADGEQGPEEGQGEQEQEAEEEHVEGEQGAAAGVPSPASVPASCFALFDLQQQLLLLQAADGAQGRAGEAAGAAQAQAEGAAKGQAEGEVASEPQGSALPLLGSVTGLAARSEGHAEVDAAGEVESEAETVVARDPCASLARIRALREQRDALAESLLAAGDTITELDRELCQLSASHLSTRSLLNQLMEQQTQEEAPVAPPPPPPTNKQLRAAAKAERKANAEKRKARKALKQQQPQETLQQAPEQQARQQQQQQPKPQQQRKQQQQRRKQQSRPGPRARSADATSFSHEGMVVITALVHGLAAAMLLALVLLLPAFPSPLDSAAWGRAAGVTLTHAAPPASAAGLSPLDAVTAGAGTPAGISSSGLSAEPALPPSQVERVQGHETLLAAAARSFLATASPHGACPAPWSLTGDASPTPSPPATSTLPPTAALSEPTKNVTSSLAANQAPSTASLSEPISSSSSSQPTTTPSPPQPISSSPSEPATAPTPPPSTSDEPATSPSHLQLRISALRLELLQLERSVTARKLALQYLGSREHALQARLAALRRKLNSFAAEEAGVAAVSALAASSVTPAAAPAPAATPAAAPAPLTRLPSPFDRQPCLAWTFGDKGSSSSASVLNTGNHSSASVGSQAKSGAVAEWVSLGWHTTAASPRSCFTHALAPLAALLSLPPAPFHASSSSDAVPAPCACNASSPVVRPVAAPPSWSASASQLASPLQVTNRLQSPNDVAATPLPFAAVEARPPHSPPSLAAAWWSHLSHPSRVPLQPRRHSSAHSHSSIPRHSHRCHVAPVAATPNRGRVGLSQAAQQQSGQQAAPTLALTPRPSAAALPPSVPDFLQPPSSAFVNYAPPPSPSPAPPPSAIPMPAASIPLPPTAIPLNPTSIALNPIAIPMPWASIPLHPASIPLNPIALPLHPSARPPFPDHVHVATAAHPSSTSLLPFALSKHTWASGTSAYAACRRAQQAASSLLPSALPHKLPSLWASVNASATRSFGAAAIQQARQAASALLPFTRPPFWANFSNCSSSFAAASALLPRALTQLPWHLPSWRPRCKRHMSVAQGWTKALGPFACFVATHQQSAHNCSHASPSDTDYPSSDADIRPTSSSLPDDPPTPPADDAAADTTTDHRLPSPAPPLSLAPPFATLSSRDLLVQAALKAHAAWDQVAPAADRMQVALNAAAARAAARAHTLLDQATAAVAARAAAAANATSTAHGRATLQQKTAIALAGARASLALAAAEATMRNVSTVQAVLGAAAHAAARAHAALRAGAADQQQRQEQGSALDPAPSEDGIELQQEVQPADDAQREPQELPMAAAPQTSVASQPSASNEQQQAPAAADPAETAQIRMERVRARLEAARARRIAAEQAKLDAAAAKAAAAAQAKIDAAAARAAAVKAKAQKEASKAAAAAEKARAKAAAAAAKAHAQAAEAVSQAQSKVAAVASKVRSKIAAAWAKAEAKVKAKVEAKRARNARAKAASAAGSGGAEAAAADPAKGPVRGKRSGKNNIRG